MKKIVILFACMILFISCKQGNSEIVRDFLEAANSFDKERTELFLTDSFMFYKNDSLNKSEYLASMDSLRNVDSRAILLKIQDLDSIVKTEEKKCDIFDSLLEVTPNVVLKKTYRFSDNKLKSVTVDTVLYYNEHYKSLNDEWTPFAFYVENQYGKQEKEDFFRNAKKYLADYASLSISERKENRTYANLQGVYVSKDCPLFSALVFRGKKTVSYYFSFIRIPIATSYEIDENLVKIKGDGADLLFAIKDSKTLIGEGMVEGTFIKQE